METTDLLNNASSHGYTVDYMPLSCNPSFCVEDDDGCHVVLSTRLHGVKEKESLAHELGHCNHGGLYDSHSPYEQRARAERRADRWAFTRLLPIGEVRSACKHGCREPWQLAELFNVSDEFAIRAISYYHLLGLV